MKNLAERKIPEKHGKYVEIHITMQLQ